MRKVTREVSAAFLAGKSKSVANTHTDGKAYFLHGNKIAEWRDGVLWITNAGWSSNTTKDRLNALPGVDIGQQNWQWYLNGEAWDGSWTEIPGTKLEA
jgi:hypothetical protein